MRLSRSLRSLMTLMALLALVVPAGAQLPADDDAGSGRDAGKTHATAIPVERNTEYAGTLNPEHTVGSDGLVWPDGDYDRFLVDAEKGEELSFSVATDSTAVCLWVYDADDVELAASGCSSSLVFFTPAAGTYGFQLGYFATDGGSYTFQITDGAVGEGKPWSHPAPDPRPLDERPTVVVAVADSGINPYHEVYRRPEMTVHPCEWVAGFDDCSIPALELSLGVYDSYAQAFEADRAVWESVEVGRWYWIPGTNIIGAVCDGSSNVGGAADPTSVCILDENGHGTGTSSSVLSEAPDALLLFHEGNSGASALEYAPVVPDIQSHSWAPPAPLPLHAADPISPFPIASRGAFDRETIFFLAAGNEAPFPTMLDSSRVHPDVQVVGGGFPGHGTALSWSTVDFASWFCRPTAQIEVQRVRRGSYCGTSFAAPTVAGAAAAALMEIREAEGYLGRSTTEMVSAQTSRETFIDALRRGATYDAESKFGDMTSATSAAVPLPPGQEHLLWGYGWLDSTRVDAVVTCALEPEDCPEPSADAQRYNDARQEVRSRSTQPLLCGDDGPQLFTHDDAGTGTDAGADVDTAIPIQRGEAISGTVAPNGTCEPGDDDWYAFPVRAGETVTATITATGAEGGYPVLCAQIVDEDGNKLAESTPCNTGGELVAVAPADGLLYVDVYYIVTKGDPYTFTVDP